MCWDFLLYFFGKIFLKKINICMYVLLIYFLFYVCMWDEKIELFVFIIVRVCVCVYVCVK